MTDIVQTAQGLACICGDVIHDFSDQIVNHIHVTTWMEPRVTGDPLQPKREETGAIKNLRNTSTVLLSIPDRPARIKRQRVLGRLGMSVAGPLTKPLSNRPSFPRVTDLAPVRKPMGRGLYKALQHSPTIQVGPINGARMGEESTRQGTCPITTPPRSKPQATANSGAARRMSGPLGCRLPLGAIAAGLGVD